MRALRRNAIADEVQPLLMLIVSLIRPLKTAAGLRPSVRQKEMTERGDAALGKGMYCAWLHTAPHYLCVHTALCCWWVDGAPCCPPQSVLRLLAAVRCQFGHGTAAGCSTPRVGTCVFTSVCRCVYPRHLWN